MFTYRSRALLWVLLLMMILPMSAFAAQEMDLQVATDDQGSQAELSVANESLSEGENSTASGSNQRDKLNEINDDDILDFLGDYDGPPAYERPDFNVCPQCRATIDFTAVAF